MLYPSTLGDDLPVFGYDFSPAHSRTYRVVACDDCSHGYCSPRALDLFAEYEDVEDASYLENRDQRLATSRLAIAKIREWFDRQLITAQGIRGQVLQDHERSQGARER